MKKLIVTADDFGIFPAINSAVIEAVKQDKLNSVAVFANYDGAGRYKSSVENLKVLLGTGKPVEVGCHLTITSGKPVTGDKMDFVCSDAGYFLSYTEMPNFKKESELKALKEELCEQVKKLEEGAGIKIKHLTNHHNSLTLFPHHLAVYTEVARSLGIPMRSVRVEPGMKQNLYLRFLKWRLRDDISRAERQEMIDFVTKSAKEFSTRYPGTKIPDVLDSCHYGPLAPFPAWLMERYWALTKRRKLSKLFNRYNTSTYKSMEIVLHLAMRDGWRMDKSKDLDYPGIDRKYFDSRAAEYRSFSGYDFGRWDWVVRDGWSNI